MSYRTNVVPFSPDYPLQYKQEIKYLEGYFAGCGAEANERHVKAVEYLAMCVSELCKLNNQLITDKNQAGQ
jgi:hypothetical protein